MAVIEPWVSLPWAGPSAYYGVDAVGMVRRLESLGVAGVVQGDHLFVPTAPHTSPIAAMAAECLTVLTTVAAHSDRLGIATLVANVGIQHPLFLLRKFANLAVIHGGERIYAGLGAGWSRRGFEAIGVEMPAHRERLDRLEEAVRLARELFDEGSADLHGDHVVASELPLAPRPAVPPRLLLGGGSRRLLELAGRYADHLDLAPPAHRKSSNEFQRKLLTTTADLEDTAGATNGALLDRASARRRRPLLLGGRTAPDVGVAQRAGGRTHLRVSRILSPRRAAGAGFAECGPLSRHSGADARFCLVERGGDGLGDGQLPAGRVRGREGMLLERDGARTVALVARCGAKTVECARDAGFVAE